MAILTSWKYFCTNLDVYGKPVVYKTSDLSDFEEGLVSGTNRPFCTLQLLLQFFAYQKNHITDVKWRASLGQFEAEFNISQVSEQTRLLRFIEFENS